MKETIPLIHSDLFEYDFSACAYNILKNTGMDISYIDFENKEKRNIQIGLMQKNNPTLNKYITDSIKNLVDFYLKENNIEESNIILMQKDGFITNKKLTKLNLTMPIDFRGMILKLIFTTDRKKWMTIYDKKNVVVKGITNKPCDVSFYQMFANIDFSNKTTCIKQLDLGRKRIYISSNIMWFARKIEDDQLLIPIKGLGLMKFRPSVLNMIDPNEIEKSFLWEDYVWPFCRSIIIHLES